MEIRLGGGGDARRTFGDGSGRRMQKGGGDGRNVDPRYRCALRHKRSQKHTRVSGPRGQWAREHEMRNRLGDDHVPLLADGLQRRRAQDLLGRLAVLLSDRRAPTRRDGA